jgi:hypothetical protein
MLTTTNTVSTKLLLLLAAWVSHQVAVMPSTSSSTGSGGCHSLGLVAACSY